MPVFSVGTRIHVIVDQLRFYFADQVSKLKDW